ncbi:sensor histidine kinase [Galbitalea sp. SE-J8]|uniref:sensor histidine kinase n=1 Tax=Galbitalea sp. SE-J8 TaxID=3054952 RepID=UPI00259C9FCC|nr:sensor histidine kinase [Galbitalea sp. SE-J8]MDM4763046.1 sensor histidine kinase [Galbitalea sp. SE-J8]
MVDPRWRRVLAVVPYLVVGILAAFGVGFEWGQWTRLVPELVLCAVFAAWVLVFRTLRRPWADRPGAIAVFMTGLIGLNLALVLLDGWFGFLAIATFTFAYSVVPWPAELFAVGATAAVAGLAQGSGFSRDARGIVAVAFVVLLNVAIMAGMSWGLRLAERVTQREGAEAERTRLAGDIHDTLAQNFAGIVTQLQAADEAADEAGRQRHTASALDLARDGLAEARRSVQALRPPALEGARLPEAIDNVARRWSARTGVPVEVSTTGSERALETEADVALLRTAQEALTNVERHAAAERVRLTLCYEPRGARLEVRDDGKGFDAAPVPGGADGDGYGLIAMRERLESLAGRLVIESRPGHGTAILAEVPG